MGQDQWSCLVCTTANHNAMPFCEMCRTPQGQVGIDQLAKTKPGIAKFNLLKELRETYEDTDEKREEPLSRPSRKRKRQEPPVTRNVRPRRSSSRNVIRPFDPTPDRPGSRKRPRQQRNVRVNQVKRRRHSRSRWSWLPWVSNDHVVDM